MTIATNTISETKEHQEPKVPESNQKQWPSKRKSECVNQNPAASSNQWHISEVISKVDTFLFKCRIAIVHNVMIMLNVFFFY